ncbi:MAG: phage tail terminator protein [Arenicellales bacterium]
MSDLRLIKPLIVTQISGSCPSFKQVAGIADITAIMKDGQNKPKIPLKRGPAAFVYKLGAGAGKNLYGNQVSQEKTERYGVMIVARHANDATGEKNSDQVDELTLELEDGLLGWQANEYFRPLTYARTAERFVKWTIDLLYYEVLLETMRNARKS